MPNANPLGTSLSTSRIRVFLSFDLAHDADLFERFVEESGTELSSFEIMGRSRAHSGADPTDTRLRRELGDVDEMIILCGEHSEDSDRMSTELELAQEAKRPYVMLWGRREKMCTKPKSAKSADAIYGWTADILHDQINMLRRVARSNELLASQRRAKAAPPAE